jgi:predicted nucleic-acid-binding protein
MRALDSSILLRYLTQDDSEQTPSATAFVESLTADEPGYVSVPVLCQIVWSLRRVYNVSAARIADVVRGLLAAQEIIVADELAVGAALETEADFVDALIHTLGRAAGCTATVTFDRRFARLDGVELLTG